MRTPSQPQDFSESPNLPTTQALYNSRTPNVPRTTLASQCQFSGLPQQSHKLHQHIDDKGSHQFRHTKRAIPVITHQLVLPEIERDIPILEAPKLEPEGYFAPTPTEVAEAIARLPQALQRCIDQINLYPGTHPAGGALAQAGLQDNKKQIDIFWRPGKPYSSDELLTVLIHEASHLFQLQSGWNFVEPSPGPLLYLLSAFNSDTSATLRQQWKAAVEMDTYAPSSYAIVGGHVEDFPEAVVLYFATLGTPMARFMHKAFPQRTAILDALFQSPPESGG